MKALKYFVSALAALMMFVGCEELGNLIPNLTSVTLSNDELTFDAEGGSETVKVTSPLAWSAKSSESWVKISPASGEGSTEKVEVTVTVEANSGEARDAEVEFSVGQGDPVVLTVSQEANAGEPENPNDPENPENPEDPTEPELTIADIPALKADTVITISGQAAATYARGFILSDGKANVLVYEQESAATNPAFGANLTVEGKVAAYGGHNQLSEAKVTVGEVAEFTLPEPVVYTAANIAEVKENKSPVLIQYEGVLSVSGNYYNIKIDGADVQGSVAYPKADLAATLKDNNGAKVKVTGYFVGMTGSDKYVSTMATEVDILESGAPIDYEKAPEKTVAEFLAAADKDTYYKLTGTVSNFNPEYCSFDLTDESGTIYVYSVNNKADWKDKIVDGGTVVLAGKYDYYENKEDASKSKHEVVNAQILSFKEAEEKPAEPVVATVAEFLAAAESADVWYKLTGKITKLTNTEYGNFTIVDDSGSVLVYGFTAKQVEKNDKSFASLNLKEGDIVTLIGTRSSFNGTAQVGGPAYYVSHEAGEAPEDPETPAEPIKATVAEFLAAEVGNQPYELTGVISNLTNTTYGNFDLVDETGKVYVYGLTAAKAESNDKSFASLGLKEGDTVTLIGTRAVYNETPQVGGPAYYVSHEPGEAPETPEEIADEVIKIADIIAAKGWTANQNLEDGVEFQLNDNISITLTKVSTSDSNFNVKDPGLRWYKSDKLTFKATKAMAEIKLITYGGASYSKPATADKGTMDSTGLVWTGDASEVTITADGSQLRVSEIKITYKK